MRAFQRPTSASSVSLALKRSALRIRMCLLGCVFIANPKLAAAANNEASATETVIVTGTRLNSTIEDLPGHIKVIDREMIEKRRYRSMLDLLDRVSGIHVISNGSRGSFANVYLRGAESNYTVVLIDGIKMNDPNNSRGGAFDFATINLAQVERVEIIHGAQSSIYGSDSLSGIINIVTRAPKEKAINAKLQTGSKKLRDAAFLASSMIGETTRVMLDLAHENDGEQLEGDRFESNATGVTLSGNLNDNLMYSVRASHLSSNSAAYPADSGGPMFSVIRDVERRKQNQTRFTARLQYQVSQGALIKLHTGYTTADEKSSHPGIAPGKRSSVPKALAASELQRVNTTINGVFNLSDQLQATLGVNHNNEKGELKGILEPFPDFTLPQDFSLTRSTTGVFGEMMYQPSKALTINFSFRNDDTSGHPSETTFRTGAQFIQDDTKYFANWGSGYKLPSFFALGHALVGNPDLKSEESTNWELGLQKRIVDDLSLTVAGFVAEYDNLIDFNAITFRMVNLNDVKSRGVDFVLEFQRLERFSLSTHVSYVDIDIVGEGELLQRPNWRGGFGVDWQARSDISINLNWLYVGKRQDSAVPTGTITLSGHSRLDLSGLWQASEALAINFSLDNALSTDYQPAIGFKGAGLRARVGVSYTI